MYYAPTSVSNFPYLNVHVQTFLGGEDYISLQNAPLMFSPSDNRTCIDLQTQQDDIVENVEGLDVVLTASTDITVDVGTIRVNIIDDSSE